MKKILFGILVGIVLIYFSIRGVDFGEVIASFNSVNYIFLAPALLLSLLIPLIRSLRWGVLLAPLETISQKRLFPITCIGYMAITVLPLRTGEIVRPYLVSLKKEIPMSSALGTIVFERLLDMLMALVLLAFVIFNATLPQWVTKFGYSLFISFAILLPFICLLYYKRELNMRFFGFIMKKFPERFKIKIESLVRDFVEGFVVLGSFKRFIYALLLTIMNWGFAGLGVYALFSFYNLELPLIAAFAVLVIIAIGISLPAAPGFIGNFQFACIVALSIFGVSKTDALGFSLIYYLLGMGLNIFLGLLFLPFIEFPFKDIFNKMAFFKKEIR